MCAYLSKLATKPGDSVHTLDVNHTKKRRLGMRVPKRACAAVVTAFVLMGPLSVAGTSLCVSAAGGVVVSVQPAWWIDHPQA